MGINLINKMKNFVIAAFLGLVASSQVEVAKEQVIGHRARLAILNNLIQIEEGSDSESDDDENVQLKGDDYAEVPAYMNKSDAHGGYKRVVPERFTEERDDQLMESVIEKYAREIKVEGKLTGTMMLNLEDAKALAAEVKSTHKDMGYYKQVDGMSVDDAFNHFDVNHDGLIEAERAPQFLRYLYPQGALDIALQ